MDAPVRLAIVGTGRMGEYHARSIVGVGELTVTAFVDPSERAVVLAQELGIEHSFSDVDELIASGVADAWVIAAPTPLHPSLVMTAAAHGIPVLCEKPLSLDADVGLRLEKAHTSGLQVGFWRRFSPPWVGAKRSIDEGLIGRPVMLRLTQWDSNPPPPAFCDPSVSGGLAVDCGIHEFDLVEWLTGRAVSRVFAKAAPLVDKSIGAVGDVDNLVILLELDDGVLASIDLSRNSRYGDDVRTEILGSEGAVFVETLPAGRIRVANGDGVRELTEDSGGDPMLDGVVAQAQAFVRSLGDSSDPVPGAAEANRALAIALAARQSLEVDDWITVDSPQQ